MSSNTFIEFQIMSKYYSTPNPPQRRGVVRCLALAAVLSSELDGVLFSGGVTPLHLLHLQHSPKSTWTNPVRSSYETDQSSHCK